MERKGICKNVGVCTMAGKVQVITDDDADFVCAECGEELEPYKEEEIKTDPGDGKKTKLIAVIAVVILLLGGGGFGIWKMLGSSKPEKITLDKNELTMTVGETAVITPKAEPEGVKITYVFKGKGKNIEVNSGGEVRALKKGDATVIVKCEENPDIRAICKINVKEPVEEPIVESTSESKEEEEGEQTPENKETPQPKDTKTSGSKNTGAGSSTAAQNGQGSVDMGYGKYVGNLKNGKPDGSGKLTFTRTYQLNAEYTAQPGEYITGIFENGKPSFVTYYKSDGTVVKIKTR
jgi:hypothetical protein